MTIHTRSVLDEDLTKLRNLVLQAASLIDQSIDQAMIALNSRDVALARQVVVTDGEINDLRYKIEEEGLRILATQQPMAGDLRNIVAALHLAVELERIGDHASGIAKLVERMEDEDDIESLHKLPKMAKRARQMVQTGIQAYADQDPALAEEMIGRDDKLNSQYNKLFRETLEEMRDDSYIRRATFLLWVGHNLERIGDRATNIAERVIFMTTGRFTEVPEEFD